MLTQQQVKLLFDYDQKTGVLTWKTITSPRVKIGDNAGCINSSGYLHTKIDGKLYLNHRIIYLWNHGYLPEFVDHRDTIIIHNQIDNLRKCTRIENGRNSKLRKDNKSGVKGVSWYNRERKWRSVLLINGKQKYLGLFKELSNAEAAIKKGRKIYHGEVTNHG